MSRLTDSIDEELTALLSPALSPGTVLAGRFIVRSLLGSGGSAFVYKAYDPQLGREIALKVLRSDRADPVALARLRREVVVAQRISSPNIVRVFDIGDSEFGPFITMELVDGEPVRSLLERGSLPIDRAVDIARQTLLALQSLHEVGVMHRDVKPGNILLDGEGLVKLADFGLARRVDDDARATNTGTFVGTLEYVAPEQALGRPAGPPSDLYSVGILLFELLTGRLPFERTSSFGAFLARVNGAPPDVRALRPDVPRWLAAVTIRLMQREPERRYPSAEAALAALDARRSPRHIRAWHGAAAALAVTVIGLTPLWRWQSRPAARLGQAPNAVVALADDGSALWQIPQTSIPHSAVVRSRGNVRWVAAIQDGSPPAFGPRNHDLTLFDARTGRVHATVTLPSGANYFPAYGPEFNVHDVHAADVTGDGTEDVIVTYVHTYWPSYAALYDPEKAEARLVLVAAGHHSFNAAADVNGDGRKDLIFSGINNRMGWFGALCAVDVPPAPSDRRNGVFAVGSSPDAVYGPTAARATLWYALLPPAYLGSATRVDVSSSEIRVEYPNGKAVMLDLHGFVRGAASPLTDPRARQQARLSAYAALRTASRNAAAGDAAAAERLLAGGRLDAIAAGDPQLVQWIDRNRATTLIRGGRVRDGLQLFESLLPAAEAPSDLAFEAAKELHLRGDVDTAVEWYQRGLREDDFVGRMKYEFLEGIVFALAEKGAWQQALDAIETARTAYNSIDDVADWYEAYIRWRSSDLRQVPAHRSPLDLVAYWRFEFRYALGVPAASLMKEFVAVEDRHRSVAPLLRSFRALLLFETGRKADAESEIRVAWSEAVTLSRQDTAVRAHVPILRQRYVQITGTNPSGDSSDAVTRRSL